MGHQSFFAICESENGIDNFRYWDEPCDIPEKTPASQQRNVVLHPEFVDGQYAFYRRPMDGYIDVGSGGGIGWTFCPDITVGETGLEEIIEGRHYH